MSIEENWTIITGEYNTKEIIVRLNKVYEKKIERTNFPWRIGIAIPFNNPQDDGLPNPEEKKYLNIIEDEIFELFQENNFALLAAIITTNNMMEFMIYTSNDKKIEDKMNQLGFKHQNYKFQCFINEDKEWNGFKEFLTK